MSSIITIVVTSYSPILPTELCCQVRNSNRCWPGIDGIAWSRPGGTGDDCCLGVARTCQSQTGGGCVARSCTGGTGVSRSSKGGRGVARCQPGGTGVGSREPVGVGVARSRN